VVHEVVEAFDEVLRVTDLAHGSVVAVEAGSGMK
jgi:hypothetical protein